MNVAEKLAMRHLIKKFRTKVSKEYTYNFKTLTLSDYELNLEYSADSKLLKSMFSRVSGAAEKARPRLRGMEKSLEDTAMFEVPPDYYNRVLLIVKKNIKEISKTQTEPDGYKIARCVIQKCVFVRGEKQTKIKIKVGGQYVRI